MAEIGLVKKLPRQAGYKEPRYTHLFCGDVEVGEEPAPAAGNSERGPGLQDRVTALEAEVSDLKRQFEEFRRQFQ